jgi:hypothetical protein
MSFCDACGNLLHPRKNAEGKIILSCNSCSSLTEVVKSLTDDEAFFNKLKNLCRSGRAEKQLKTLARSLSIPETQLHDVLKTFDDQGRLPYGYYDKIERIYVRTHLTDEIPEELVVDMIKQSYGYDIFGAKGLSNYISLGKNTSVRKVLQSLHGLRKKGLLRGYKRGMNWLWRLPRADEESTTPFFPKKEGSDDSRRRSKSSKNKNSSDEFDLTDSESDKTSDNSSSTDDSTKSSEDVEDDDDYDEEEEEQDDSKMVYFADPEDDDDE